MTLWPLNLCHVWWTTYFEITITYALPTVLQSCLPLRIHDVCRGKNISVWNWYHGNQVMLVHRYNMHPCIGSSEITLCVPYCKYFKHDYYICVMALWVNTNPPLFKSLDHILVKTVPKYIQFKSIPFSHWDQHFSMTLLFPSFSFLSCGTLASPCW